MNNASLARVRVWDLPTRVFHWALAAGVVGTVVMAKLGLMEWHMRLGQSVLVLLVFRIFWGFVGGRWSRFAHFFRAPGHDLKGSLSVLAMLLWLLAQTLSGLVADDEILYSGPLRARVDESVSQFGTHWHVVWGQWGVYVLVGMHLAAIAWYVARRRVLVRPMIDGDKSLDAAVPAARDDWRSRALALALIVLITLGYVVSISA